jgi:hypothetical protein
MDKSKMEVLDDVIKLARMIEQCQTLSLLTPEDQARYILQLNIKTHLAINNILV